MIVPQTRTPLTSEEIEIIFRELVNQWQQETRGISSSTELILHPSYQQIIGMGRDVVPLLLRELEQKSGRWFWALQSITRQNPVPMELRGKTKEMIKIWLEWGRDNGYQW
jgi:hypothetical protein